MKVLVIFLAFLISAVQLSAQKDEVNKYLRLVAYGKIDEVRAVIPDLLAKYPNDAGVKLLHGTILDDAFLALDVYKNIITNFPESEWADHAYWRIVQFYAVLGDTAKAQAELANFRSRYPASPFITPASDVVRSCMNLTRKNLKSTMAGNPLPKAETAVTPSVTKIAAKESPVFASADKNTISSGTASGTIVKLESKSEKPVSKTDEIEKLQPLKKEHPVETVKVAALPEKKSSEITLPKPLKEDEVKKDISAVEVKSEGPAFFGLQVGIYKDKNTADSEKNKFLVKRLRTQVVEKDVNGTIMFAVVIGHYSSQESAEEGKKIVSIQCSCEPIIYKK